MTEENGYLDRVETTRTDLLMTILQELREMRKERAERDDELNKRIANIERELDLVRNEQARQGVELAEMKLACMRRPEMCRFQATRPSVSLDIKGSR